MPLGTNSDARYSATGVGRPFLRSHLPDETKQKAWRQSVGNGYVGPIPALLVPEGRNFRVRLGLNFGLGRGYRLGYGDSDPYYADPSEQELPYAVESNPGNHNTDTPEVLKVKRWSIPGVARPWTRSNYPTGEPDESWRRGTGNTIGMTTSISDIEEMPETITASEETASTPTYTVEVV